MNHKFSENLKKVRKDNNLSQEQLAEELGVSRQAISKWESAMAYPEMDKIIALCEKFNLNIDDLLYKDIREIKKEEEGKKNINNYLDEFLNYITNALSMFSNMSFKSKVKCLFEQFVICTVLFIVFLIIGTICRSLFLNILYQILPNKLYYILLSILKAIYVVFAISVSVIILLHIFKTRYLDYYESIKKESIKEEKEEIKKQELNQKKNIDLKNKFVFRNNEKKIIIRDPKHSEYKFITGLLKFTLGIIKFFTLCFSLVFFLTLIVLTFSLILSFLIIKTGFLFIGTLIFILSLILITVICLSLILNFVFDRKNNKKLVIQSTILSTILIGVGGGLFLIGLLNFEFETNPKDYLKTDYIELEMNDNLFLDNYYPIREIEYIESTNTNIKIEYQVGKYHEVSTYNYDNSGISFGIYCTEPFKLVNYIIKKVNNKKIINITNEFESFKVYTTKENMEKLKNNKKIYYSKLENEQNIINEYENEINELKNKINEYERKIYFYEEHTIPSLKDQINNVNQGKSQ